MRFLYIILEYRIYVCAKTVCVTYSERVGTLVGFMAVGSMFKERMRERERF